MLTSVVEQFREALWTILLSGLALLGALFIGLVLIRLWLKLQAWRRTRLDALYTSLVHDLTNPATAGAAMQALAKAPRRHLDVIGRLVLKPLALTEGQVVDYLRAGATTIGLERHWRQGMRSRRPWERAESVHALGLLRKPGFAAEVVPLLGDPHEDVRAAAVGALGWLADPGSVPALLVGLSDETRHQKVRIVEALQGVGEPAGPAVLDHIASRLRPDPVLIELVGHLRLTAAMDYLLVWAADTDPAVRAAAFRTLALIGPDDRAHYHALKALNDESGDVAAMAARTLGRGGREDAVPYLTALLHREWHIAVEAARALQRLGTTGHAALETTAAGEGDAAALAGHMLWEGRFAGAR